MTESDFRARLDASIANQYVIERELGGGGMSRTYVATERALNRRVVIKVLAPELLHGVSVERFNREVLLAAQLQHPHIVPVLGAGDADGLPWFSMPYVDGESARARLAHGPLAIGEVISILRDVARALAFAHTHGVVHRDIKPDNVLLAAGSATVTDFGIAKAISAIRGDAPGGTLTAIGTSIGTPAYMAPEQAAGDPGVDHRADFYSLGVLAYELLCGQTPFTNLPPSRMLAAQLSEKPRDIRELRVDTPPALAQLVMRCLDKIPENRPALGADIVKVLDSVTSSGAGQAAPAILAGGQMRLGRALAIWGAATLLVALTAWAATSVIGLPDWALPGSVGVMMLGLPIIGLTAYVQRTAYRLYTATPAFTPGGNTAAHGTIATMALKASPHVSWRRTWIGGAVAVGAFAALVIGFMVMRALGIGAVGSLIGKGAFGQNETIIVADFKSPASDSTLGVTVSEALRTDLAQSKNLRVLTKAAVAEVLRLMQKPAEATVPFTLAREVASREGAKAVLDGDIVELGGSYVISARLVGALDGVELAAFRRTAKNQGELVEVLGELSKDIRSKVGESLRQVRESIPLERVSTSSLPALRKYVEGVQIIASTGDNAKGRALLLEAVALDSTFAMAWRRIAASYSAEIGSQAAAQAALVKAYTYRERLSENERLLTEASYWGNGPTPSREKAIAAYESLIERDSANRSALNNVAIQHWSNGDREKAEFFYRRAVAVATPFGGSFTGLQRVQLEQRKFAAAESTRRAFEKTFPTHGLLAATRAALYLAKGEMAPADSIMRAAFPTLRGDDARGTTAFAIGSIATARGRVREGLRWTAQALPTEAAPASINAARLASGIDSAWVQAYYLGDINASKATLKRVLDRTPITSLAPPDRPWASLLALAAVSRDAAAARSYFASYERDLPSSQASMNAGARPVGRGYLALAEGKFAEAAAQFGEASRTDLGSDVIGPWYAQALDLAGQPDSAIVEFEKYTAYPDASYQLHRDYLAGSHKRLGELYDAKGNSAKAMEHYQKFIDLWKDADPELQPKVREARARLEALRRKGTRG
ncbi:MAG: protein kinase [Gemmatimonadetes bacterium]|nr:protein kinase [Gemmatimonadota bacterium]